MIGKSAGQSLLENAYKLSTPKDNVDYYDAFASTYDTEFADALGYYYPAAIVATYRDAASQSDTPIADIGCGTGLVATALNLPREQVDGIDISPEMLGIAEKKQLYRSLYKVDLTKSLDEIAAEQGMNQKTILNHFIALVRAAHYIEVRKIIGEDRFKQAMEELNDADPYASLSEVKGDLEVELTNEEFRLMLAWREGIGVS